MSNADTAAQSRYRADRAQSLLSDEMLKEAFDKIETGTIEQMLMPNIPDEKRREMADRVNAIRAVRQQLQNEITIAGGNDREPIKAP